MPPRLPPPSCRAALRARSQRVLHTAPPAAATNRTLTTRTWPSSRPPPASAAAARRAARPNTPTLSLVPGRAYHSYDHPSADAPFSPAERALLAAAYAHVPAHGFSCAALSLGARDAGYPDISTNLLPHGAFSLVQWHLVTRREALAGRAEELFGAAERAGERIGVGRKVEALTWERLMGNREVIGRWQEALAIMAQPSYVPESLRELARLSDELWFLVGDTSVDPSWYTKRASLSAIYASAELFMTTDKSEGFAETRKFLRRRLDEVQHVGGSLRSLGQWVGFTASAGLNVLRSKGMRI